MFRGLDGLIFRKRTATAKDLLLPQRAGFEPSKNSLAFLNSYFAFGTFVGI
jgi:hypothetical protein